MNSRRALWIEHQRCLDEIRSRPGLGRFLRPQTLADLVPLLEHIDGPVVLFNIHSARCDALVLFPGGSLKSVPLSDLTQDRASNLHERFTNDLQDDLELSRILGHLWSWIVHPVLKALNFVRNLIMHTWDMILNRYLGDMPRTFASYHLVPYRPSHSAPTTRRRHLPTFRLAGPHVFDFVVSSYTPSLAALARPWDDIYRPPPQPSLLLAGQPGAPPTRKGELVQQIMLESEVHSISLSGEQSTLASVEFHASQFVWLDLTCRCRRDLAYLMQSVLVLYDGTLSLESLMSITFASNSKELAFLSTVRTAIGLENSFSSAADYGQGHQYSRRGMKTEDKQERPMRAVGADPAHWAEFDPDELPHDEKQA